MMNSTANSRGAKRRQVWQLPLREAVIDWLNAHSHAPDGIAMNVGMYQRRDKVDVGAVWLGENAPKIRGQVFICCSDRKECWPGCSVSENILAELVNLKRERGAMEEQIRQDEPDLRATDMLFEELAQWDYARSSNAEYHSLCQRISSLEGMVYNGTRLQHISEHPLCSGMYVVVPEGILSCDELLDDWGLLWFKRDGTLEEMRSSARHRHSADDSWLFMRRILNSSAKVCEAYLNCKVK